MNASDFVDYSTDSGSPPVHQIMHSLERLTTPQPKRSQTSTTMQLMDIFWQQTEIGIWTLSVNDQGTQFYVTDRNPAGAKISPIRTSLVTDKPLTEVLPLDIAKRHQTFYKQAIEHQQTVTFEDCIEKNQQFHWWSITVLPIVSEHHRVDQLIVTFTDIGQYKQAEIKQAELAQTLQQIIDSIPASIVWKDRQSIYQGCNQHFLALTRYDNPQTIVGKTDYDMPWQPEETEWYLECDRKIMDLDIPELGIIEPQQQVNGTQAWLSTSKIPLHDTNGEVNGILVVIEDITERKTAEAELSLKDQAIATSPVGIVIADAQQPDLPATYINAAFEEQTGYTAQEVLGQNFRFLQNEDQDQPGLIPLRQAVAKGERCTVLLRNYHKDGTLFWNELTIAPIFDKQGTLTHFMGLQNDVTARKLADLRLQEYADHQMLVNQITTQIRQSLNADTILDTAIQSIYQILHLDLCAFAWLDTSVDPTICVVVAEKSRMGTSTIGVYSTDVIGPIDKPLIENGILWMDQVDEYPEPRGRTFLQTIGAKSSAIVAIQVDNPRLGVILCNFQNDYHTWEKHEIELLKSVANQLAIAIDQAQLYSKSKQHAHELANTLQELQRAQAQLIQVEKMSSLGQMVAGVAHEINNPANFIHGNIAYAKQYTEELLDLVKQYQQTYPVPPDHLKQAIEDIDLDYLKQDFFKLLTSMETGTDRIRKIVQSLRTFSRLDESEEKVIDLHESLESTIMIINSRLKNKKTGEKITLIREYDDLPPINCYAGLLNQVFMHLLGNAIDALTDPNLQNLPEKPTITLKTEICKEQAWVKISITDNGPGIPNAVRDKLFDPFFTTKPIGQGTGLGLSISHQIIVDRHQGRLYCDTNPDQGTTFVVEIPVEAATSI